MSAFSLHTSIHRNVHASGRNCISLVWMCTEEYRGLKQVGVIILYYIVTVFAHKNWPRKGIVRTVSTTSVNVGWLCKLQQWGISNCSHSALSSTHLQNNEFSSELPWFRSERDWCLESHSLTGLFYSVWNPNSPLLWDLQLTYSRHKKTCSEQKVVGFFWF